MADLSDDSHGTRRYNISVPIEDESTIRFLDALVNKSTALRLMCHEYIERYGYVDPMCRPVTQMPRRGRPPMHDDERFESEQRSASHDHDTTDDRHDDPVVVSESEQVASEVVSTPVASPAEPRPAPASPLLDENGMIDMNAMLGH